MHKSPEHLNMMNLLPPLPQYGTTPMSSFFCCAGERDDPGEEDGSVVKESRFPVKEKRGGGGGRGGGSNLEMSAAAAGWLLAWGATVEAAREGAAGSGPPAIGHDARRLRP